MPSYLGENDNIVDSAYRVDHLEELKNLATKWNLDFYSENFSRQLDNSKIYPSFREKFFYPKMKDLSKVDLSLVEDSSDECIYLCGNSLGLQPKTAQEYVQRQFDKWKKIGVYGHHEGELPWASCDEPLRPAMSKIVGGKIDEVGIMNFLTVNLHLMMITFYQPTQNRYKILIEEKAFPSDHYVVESQIRLHNLDPKDCMILIKPRKGENNFRTEDILQVIREEGDSIALCLLSGVHYFTGQLFDIKEITNVAHLKECYIGWDLAHAVGNVELKLHEWNVDFACWCTYKYLNAGAGSIGGIFLHEKHFEMNKSKKLDGWWSHKSETRFKMSNNMEYAPGSSSYALSNPSMLLCSCLKASLDIFDETSMSYLRKRSILLTGYLEALLEKICDNQNLYVEYLTPKNPLERGSQLSLRFSKNVSRVYDELEKRGVVCDFREPDVLRFAPTSLYNSFNEMYKFSVKLNESLMAVLK